jgi:galactokinase
VNLIGEHTDYSGGLVFPAAIDLGITITGTAAERIVLVSDATDAIVELAANGAAETPVEGWGRYVAAVAHELDQAGRPAVGFSGVLRSTLPSGAGLSSSAALEVAIATALCSVAEWDGLSPPALAVLCQRAEWRAVGVSCGIMDQAASILGREGCALYLDCRTLECEAVSLPKGLALLVIDSGVRHEHERSGYTERRRELEQALVVLAGRRPRDVRLGEARKLAGIGGLDELHWRRLRHVVTENQRVRDLASALRANGSVDRSELGRIFLEGHASLRDDYQVSIPELDCLVELAYEAGAVAARMTGGGFGGSIVALVEQGDARSLSETVREAYAGRFATQATPRICLAATGARELA